jgi:hypothetical protein
VGPRRRRSPPRASGGLTTHVVVPFIRIHPLTERALRELAPDAERVDLRGGTAKYADLLETRWRDADGWLNVEHDIELTADALREAIECPCLWSTSQYQGENGLITHALGCTRFRADLIRAVPDAMARARRDASFGRGQYLDHWLHIDSKLAAVLLGEGYEPHVHSEVPHHHVYRGRCACGGEHG